MRAENYSLPKTQTRRVWTITESQKSSQATGLESSRLSTKCTLSPKGDGPTFQSCRYAIAARGLSQNLLYCMSGYCVTISSCPGSRQTTTTVVMRAARRGNRRTTIATYSRSACSNAMNLCKAWPWPVFTVCASMSMLITCRTPTADDRTKMT